MNFLTNAPVFKQNYSFRSDTGSFRESTASPNYLPMNGPEMNFHDVCCHSENEIKVETRRYRL